MPHWQENENQMLRCIQCGDYYPAATTNDGDLLPIGGASGSRCHECGGDEFEQVKFSPSA